MVYDFDFSEKSLAEVCEYNDTINNPNPVLGCHFYQAALGFSAFSWSHPHPLAAADHVGFCGLFP